MRFFVVILVAFVHASAHAGTHATLRVDVLPLNLEPSAETPLFGDRVTTAIADYNVAAAAHDRQTGATTPRIAASDLGVSDTLVVVAPGLETGVGHYLFRLEVPFGISNERKTIGLAMYPIGVQAALAQGIVAYAVAGGSASYLDRDGPGDRGGLFTARAAFGARFAENFLAEVGYVPFALGGSVNTNMMTLDRSSLDPALLDDPSRVVAAGSATNLIDVSLGVSF